MSVLNTDQKLVSGAQIVLNTLVKLGVTDVFGYPGGVILYLYDELYKQDKIKHYLVRHEQAAVHAADGYARVSGKCGVVFVTSGPGAANIVTGLANAYKDGYPLLVITGQVRRNSIGKGAFGEVDICDITKSCTKANFQINNPKDLQQTIINAYNTAMSAKKGPVVIDIVKDVFLEKAEYDETISLNNFEQVFDYDDEINTILEEITKASRPVIISGGGVVHSKAAEELKNFVKYVNMPVVNTMMGLGTYSQVSKNYFGMIGLFGNSCANTMLKEADLIISLGARLNNRVTCCFKNNELNNKIIQIDINPEQISKTIPAKFHLVGDLAQVLKALNKKLSNSNFEKNHYDTWLERCNSLKHSDKAYIKKSKKLHSFEVLNAINSYTKPMHPIITTEVGQHQIWAARIFNSVNCGEFLTSGGLGTMGFGLPASIGACIAKPEKCVICIAGDGSFQMNIQELATIRQYNLPVKIFVMNNGYLGMVRQLQEKACEGRYSQIKIVNPDFVKLAEAYGIKAFRVEELSQMQSVLCETFNSKEPVLVDFVVEPMEVL